MIVKADIELNKQLIVSEDFLNNLGIKSLSWGIKNVGAVLEEAEGDLNNVRLTLYNSKKIGCGITFFNNTEENKVVLSTSLPTTQDDIQFFQEFLTKFLENVQSKQFDMNQKEKTTEDISSLFAKLKQENLKQFQGILKHKHLTFFGAIYPIDIGKMTLLKLQGMKINRAMKYFTKYLDDRQRQEFFYNVPVVYETQHGDVVGVYKIRENIKNIMTLYPHLPHFFEFETEDKEVGRWAVHLYRYKPENVSYEFIGEIDFETFKELAKLNDKIRFDEGHVILDGISEEEMLDFIEKGSKTS